MQCIPCIKKYIYVCEPLITILSSCVINKSARSQYI